MRPSHALRAGLALLATLTLHTTALADWPHDPTLGGVLASTNPGGSKLAPGVVPDAAGGCIVVWQDAPGSRLLAQRLDARGLTMWGANGLEVCTVLSSQFQPQLLMDGSGGLIVTWTDNRAGTTDIYSQRISAAGVRLWAAAGVPVCTATGAQDSPTAATDGAGGVTIAWRDVRGADSGIYFQRLDAAGALMGPANGSPLSNLPGDQSQPTILASPQGGYFVAWSDRRNQASTDADIYLQRLDAAANLLWTPDGWPVVTALAEQSAPRLTTDGNGGVFVAWNDARDGVSFDIYAQRFSAAGLAQFASNGIVVCAAPSQQYAPVLAPDGSGGAFIAWQDYRTGSADVYAARVSQAGALPWAANGVPVDSSQGLDSPSVIASDAAGGAYLVWTDTRSGNSDIFAQRLTPSGAPYWPVNGIAVCSAAGSQGDPHLVLADDGALRVVWLDQRSGSSEIYAQRVDRWGNLGRPEPQITQARDVAGDQGGQVKLTWAASYLDADPSYAVTEYRVFRSAPVSLALAAHRAVTHDPDVAAETGALLRLPNAAADVGWEYVGSNAADALPAYSRVVATTTDSSAAGNKRTLFMVEARAGSNAASPRWFSLPDSAYSVDNLPPAAPAALTGQYAAGTAHLLWQPNVEPDLDHYRVYRGANVAFTPSPANLVTSATLPGYTDPAGAPHVYKVTAVDVHGNESPVATLVPAGTLAVDDAPLALAFAAPQPNPARGATTLRWALPRAAHVTIALYDAAGRRVATVADGPMAAGMHAATLELRDASGRALPSGLYLARFEAEGRTITRRIAAIR